MKKTKKNKQISKPLIAIAAVLLITSVVSWKAYDFASSNVRDQLSEQKIYFPTKESGALDPATYPDLQKYAGQQVDSGAKAKAYADGYIKKHLEKIANGKTYSQVSSEYLKNPTDEKLAEQRQSLFMGTTLRGLLLNAYAFGVMASILQVMTILSFIGAVVMALLAVRKKLV